MSELPRLGLVLLLAGLLASCASQTGSRMANKTAGVRRISKVRTTAYTHTEKGGRRNAVGKRLCGHDICSAASDWSRFPFGTKFRIVDMNEIFQIDDYGSALIGTDTID